MGREGMERRVTWGWVGEGVEGVWFYKRYLAIFEMRGLGWISMLKLVFGGEGRRSEGRA